MNGVRFSIASRYIGKKDVQVIVEAESDRVSLQVTPADPILQLRPEDARWLADSLHAACHTLNKLRADPHA